MSAGNSEGTAGRLLHCGISAPPPTGLWQRWVINRKAQVEHISSAIFCESGRSPRRARNAALASSRLSATLQFGPCDGARGPRDKPEGLAAAPVARQTGPDAAEKADAGAEGSRFASSVPKAGRNRSRAALPNRAEAMPR